MPTKPKPDPQPDPQPDPLTLLESEADILAAAAQTAEAAKAIHGSKRELWEHRAATARAVQAAEHSASAVERAVVIRAAAEAKAEAAGWRPERSVVAWASGALLAVGSPEFASMLHPQNAKLAGEASPTFQRAMTALGDAAEDLRFADGDAAQLGAFVLRRERDSLVAAIGDDDPGVYESARDAFEMHDVAAANWPFSARWCGSKWLTRSSWRGGRICCS